MYVIIIILILFYFMKDKTIENFVEYNQNNKRYLDTKRVSRQFVYPEYLIDPYVRHTIPKRTKNLILKEFRYMKSKEKKDIEKVLSTCCDNGESNIFSKDTLVLHYYVKNKLVGCVGLLTTHQLERYLADNKIWQQSIFSLIDQHGLYIHNLCILPEYRNKCIYDKLMSGIVNYANEIRALYIGVVAFNPIKLHRIFVLDEYAP